MNSKVDVSIVLPIHNADEWLNECLQGICNQEITDIRVELSVFFDSCSDQSKKILNSWLPEIQKNGIEVIFAREENSQPKGVGYAKNKAISQSQGEYLCFADADDVILPRRIQLQYELASQNKGAIIGCQFRRDPTNSTKRFSKWANNLTPMQLNAQIFTSHGPTVVMPTWFCHRSVIEKVGGFSEEGKGTPEDLIFFYKHLRLGGTIARVDEELVIYRYHVGATTFSIDENTIWKLRVNEIEENVLRLWPEFTIWNGGKQGRKFYRSLREGNKLKVSCFCDVDKNKIGSFYTDENSKIKPKRQIPIVCFKDARPPFVICVKMDLTGGDFENNLASLKLTEFVDYHHFN